MISVKDGSGNAVDIHSDAGFNHAYTYRGYRYDQESGLYFLQSRYYQAGTGSFLTKDTVKGDPQDSQSLNRYAYTSGDPVNYFDPDGHGMVMNDDGTGPVVYTASSSSASKGSPSVVSSAVTSTVSTAIDEVTTRKIVPKIPDYVNVGVHNEYTPIRDSVSVPGARMIKSISKITGPIAIASYGYDMWQDAHRYHGSDMAIAMGITTGFAAAGVYAGLFIGGLTIAGAALPLTAVVLLSATAGLGINYLAVKTKEVILGY